MQAGWLHSWNEDKKGTNVLPDAFKKTKQGRGQVMLLNIQVAKRQRQILRLKGTDQICLCMAAHATGEQKRAFTNENVFSPKRMSLLNLVALSRKKSSLQAMMGKVKPAIFPYNYFQH